MAALAYLLLPVSGAAAYLLGNDERTRGHGLQAIFLGLAWPLVLYAASFFSPTVTQVAFVLGIALWGFLLVGTALGRDPKIPFVGASIWRLATASVD